MRLLISSLKKEIKTLQDNNIKLCAIGNLNTLPKKVHKELTEVMEKTKQQYQNDFNLSLKLWFKGRIDKHH